MAKKSSGRVKITQQTIRTVTVPPDKRRVEVFDSECRGLAIFITRAGSKVWYLNKTIAGRLWRWPIGEFPAVVPEQARKLANRIIGQLADGVPAAEVSTARTVAVTATQNDPLMSDVLLHAETSVWPDRAKTWKQHRQIVERYHPGLLRLNASQIDLPTVRRMHTATGKTAGHHSANRWRTVWRSLFKIARTDFRFTGADPFELVKPFTEASRSRRLSQEETGKLIAAIEAEPLENPRDLLTFALLTAARRGNLFGARFEDFNLATGIWTIPEGDTKSGVEIELPLVPKAVAIVERRLKAAAGRPWLFHGRNVSKPMVDGTKPFQRACGRAGIEGLRFHDLRRSVASWMVDTGAADLVVGAALGHAPTTVTGIYARPSLDAIRAALVKATDSMWSQSEGVVIDAEEA